MSLQKSHFVVHYQADSEYPDALDEEFFEVVTLDTPGMVAMTEETLGNIAKCFPGYKDHIIVPVEEAENGTLE